jgi:hypothetical protein
MPNPAERADALHRDAPISLPVEDEVGLLLGAVLGRLSLHIDELCFSALEALRTP